ncbi:MAG: zinc ribbon domain-containing protein [Pyrinomonadaceae bacterium]|nr:zinc ribbon domain-containing protein [Chthoniobacterales bacterium]MBA3572222.1 zinc ribbon domain-containing protein [Pyrinomonadaceae bacterium]
MEIILFWAIVGGFVGALIGQRKGRTGEGAVLGLILGPIGWLVVALGPDYKTAQESRKCPFCAELVKKEANVCKHCGRDLPASA